MFCIILPFKTKKVNLGPYLHELLLEHETVIVPGFGAFISNYKPAEINRETNKITPPSKEITFHQKIRNNDGLLVGRVAEGEAVSHFDALKLIEKERENIIYQLDKGEEVFFENTGILFRNEKNEIDFEPQTEENLLLDSFGLEPLSLEPEQEKEIAAGAEKEEKLQEDEISGQEDVVEGEPEEPEKSTLEDAGAQFSAAQEQVRKGTEELSSEEKLPEKEQTPEPEPVMAEAPFLKDKPDEKEKKRSWLWFLLLLIPLVAAGIYLAKDKLFPEKAYKIVLQEEAVQGSQAPENNVIVADSIVTDSVQQIPADTMNQPAKDVPSPMLEPGAPRFYLVGGSFREEENVDKFMKQFDAEGYEPFYLGKRGSFYIVAIGVYSTEKEAVIARDSFTEQNPGSGTWVFEDKTE